MKISKIKSGKYRWEPFFDGQEALGDLIDQTDDLRGLLNSDAFVGKNGGLTIDGIANLALISQGMNAAKQQIKNYNEALKKLDEDLKNGNISTEEFEEQQKDFLDQISSSVNIVEDYKNSIVDLYKQQLEPKMIWLKNPLINTLNYWILRRKMLSILRILGNRQKISMY